MTNFLKRILNISFEAKSRLFSTINNVETRCLVSSQKSTNIPHIQCNRHYSCLNKTKMNTVLLQTPQIMNEQIREYKAKMRLRKRCKQCYFLWRNGRVYVECPQYPSHKQHHKFSLEKGYDNLAHGYHKPIQK